MSINRFTLKLISPAFIAGSDKNYPEMRASSVRGQLRYWLRAILGAQNPSLNDVWREEEKIFGSTNVGSAVSVRVYRETLAKIEDYAMLPHRSNEGKRESSIQKALVHGQNWDLELVTRPSVDMPKEAIDALIIWSLLGGVGRRSRRMFGGVQITAKNHPDNENLVWYDPPNTVDELIETMKDKFKALMGDKKLPTIPAFPTLNSAHSWVIMGQNRYDNYEDVVTDLFKNLLRIPQFISKEETFGGIRPRRSSPLIAQVRRIGKDSYYPVLTALRSKPDGNIDWLHLKKFMDAAQSYFNGVTVWGGW